MKKPTFCLLSFLFLLTNGFSQITYTAGDYAAVGDTFVISTVNNGLGGLNFANTGPNYSWVFDSLEISDQNVRRIENPDNTGYFLTWYAGCILNLGNVFTCPGIWADLTDQGVRAGEDISFGGVELSSSYNFYKKTSSTYEATIFGASIGLSGVSVPVAVNYEEIDTLYQFPLTYLGQDSSFSRLKLSASNGGTGFVSVQEHRRVNEVDGWGSLTTPYATYDSVIRMKTLLYNNDTIILNGNPIAVPTTSIEYKWFAKGEGQPVMTASGTRTQLGDLLNSVEFIDSLRCLTPNASFIPFPPVANIDSASGLADVSFINLSGNSDQYTWVFGDGTGSGSSSPSHQYGPGIYQVQLIACNNICNPQECDTVSLPLTVINSFAPIANIGLGTSSQCQGDSILFDNNSLNAQSYFWDFGDGNTSTDESPTHLYANPDTYNITFIAINGRYRDTAESEVIVLPAPEPELGQDTIYLPSDSAASISPGTFLAYQWSTGETTPQIDVNGSQTGIDTLLIWVDVFDENGCSRRDSLLVIGVRAVGIADKGVAACQIFPNPAGEQLNLLFPEGMQDEISCKIMDLSGKLVFQQKLEGGRLHRLSLKSLEEGFYFIQIENKKQRLTKKIVVRR